MPLKHTATVVSTKPEAGQSIISYLLGGGLATSSLLADVANVVQVMGIFFGCIIVAIRAAHDCLVFIRYLKSGDKKDNRK